MLTDSATSRCTVEVLIYKEFTGSILELFSKKKIDCISTVMITNWCFM